MAPATGWVPPGDERLAFTSSEGGAHQRAVRFDDGTEIEEYARIGAGDWHGEYLYLSADDTDLALTATFDVARAIGLFRRSAGRAPALGQPGRIDKAGSTVFFRPFSLPHETCFGFQLDWPRKPGDPHGQAGQLLVGYACRPATQPAAPQDIKVFLADLSPQAPVTPDHLPALPRSADALEFALGRDATGDGLVNFPLALSRDYVAADGELL